MGLNEINDKTGVPLFAIVTILFGIAGLATSTVAFIVQTHIKANAAFDKASENKTTIDHWGQALEEIRERVIRIDERTKRFGR